MSISPSSPSSIIEAIKNYLSAYTEIEEAGAPVWVEYLGTASGQFSINALPGERIIEEYIDGSKLMSFPFSIQSVENTDEDPDRIAANQFYEALADWFETQTDAGDLPDLPTGKTAEEIHATTWGYPNEYGESGTDIYLMQCEVIYKQAI